jgi:N utilization substance protein A
VNFSELGRVIEQLGKDRGIKKEFIVGAIEQAFLVTARKKFGIQGEYEARYNEEDGEVEIFQYKNVVEKVRDSIVEIEFDSAKKGLKFVSKYNGVISFKKQNFKFDTEKQLEYYN